MTDDEVVLTSFVLEEESLLDTWTIIGAGTGSSRVPPQPMAKQLVAVTDERLMWYDGQLEDVDLGEDPAIDHTDYSHTTTPPTVRSSWGLFVFGLLGSVGLFFLTDFDLATVTVPAAGGLLAVLVASAVARSRGETGEEVDIQRLTVEGAEETATLWGETEPIEDIQAVLEGEERPDRDGGTDADDATELTEDTSVEANEDTTMGDGEDPGDAGTDEDTSDPDATGEDTGGSADDASADRGTQ